MSEIGCNLFDFRGCSIEVGHDPAGRVVDLVPNESGRHGPPLPVVPELILLEVGPCNDSSGRSNGGIGFNEGGRFESSCS